MVDLLFKIVFWVGGGVFVFFAGFVHGRVTYWDALAGYPVGKKWIEWKENQFRREFKDDPPPDQRAIDREELSAKAMEYFRSNQTAREIRENRPRKNPSL